MDFETAAHITAQDQYPLSHVRLLDNTEDMIFRYDPRSEADWEEYPDQANPVTDTLRDHQLTIHFDTATDLEWRLFIDAVTAFVRRRTSAMDIVIETT